MLLTVSSISQVYTVEELKNEMSTRVGDDSCFTGILFAYLTTLNIDQGLGSVLCHRWYVGDVKICDCFMMC